MNDSVKEPHDFVYVGKRYTEKKKTFIAVQIIKEDGTLNEKPYYYEFKRNRDRIVGGVYTGASFDKEGSVSGIDSAQYLRRWGDADAVRGWQIEDRQSEVVKKRDNLEKDAGRISELERLLLPLRKDHAALARKYARSDIMALEAAVLDALRTPPRASEKE